MLLFGGSTDPLELSQAEFEAARKARSSHLTLLGIEEKFDILLESYFDYERAHLDLALRQMVSLDLSHPTLVADIRLINRRLLALLAAGKLYSDHLAHDFTELYGRNSSKWLEVAAKHESLQADSLGFQVATSLRDHIQHRGLPLNTLYYQYAAKDADGQRRLQLTTEPHLHTRVLRHDRKVNASTRARLEALGDRVPVNPLIKDYLGCLGLLHEEVRRVTASDGDSWTDHLQDLMDKLTLESGETIALAIVELAPDGSYDSTHQVFSDLLELRKLLLRKNALLTNLAHRFVSTEPPPQGAV